MQHSKECRIFGKFTVRRKEVLDDNDPNNKKNIYSNNSYSYQQTKPCLSCQKEMPISKV